VGSLVDGTVVGGCRRASAYVLHLAGWRPLWTMLNSCSGHVVVVNIDRDQGGYVAARIARVERAAQTK